MKECLIVGKANAGKTLFLVNFAEYLGVKEFHVIRGWGGRGTREELRLNIPRARALLVNANPHTTTELQTVELTLPRGKGNKVFFLTDTAGLIEKVHAEESIRRAIARTLRAVHEADVILHLIDASRVGDEGSVEAVSEVDRQLARYAPLRGRYVVLANKMDLPWAASGLVKVRDEFRAHRVIPVSALEKRGFKEVKAYVWSLL